MPLDHYVSQTHLRQFYSPTLGSRLYGTKKADLVTFSADSFSQCRTKDGSTNEYLTEPRVIEDFLKTVEPRYNEVVARLGLREIDHECVYVIASFVAYVQSCSPAAMRIAVKPLEAIVEESARRMDLAGAFPTPPTECGPTSLSQLLDDGTVQIIADGKYPQAIGIGNILKMVETLGKFSWEILLNSTGSAFFTSDFPVAIEETRDARIRNKIIPLSPFVAVRIVPRLDLDKSQGDFSFAQFRYLFRSLDRGEVRYINSLIVRCAETTVYHRENPPWVRSFIGKNTNFRIEPVTKTIPKGKGTLIVSTLAIRAHAY